MSRSPRVLIVGAGRGQLGLYRAAKRMGLTTIAAGVPGKYPGLKLADEKCYVDISSPQAVVAEAKKLDIDAVVTSCMDTGVAAVGAVNDELGLKGIGYNQANDAFDKIKQKEAFDRGGVPAARSSVVHTYPQVEELSKEYGLPLVLKRRRSQGSEGVFVVKSLDEAKRVVAQDFGEGEDILVEEYLEGDEFGAQAMVVDGEIKYVMPHGDLLYMGHAPIPVGHYLPLDQPDNVRAEAIEAAKKAIRASEFDNCAVNIDFRLNNGSVNLIELTGRAGANGLPELAGLYLGVDYYEQILRIALGDDVTFVPQKTAGCDLVQMVLPSSAGTVRSIDLSPVSPEVIDVQSFIEVGDTVSSFESLKDCLGLITVRGRDKDECVKKAAEQTARTFEIE